MHARPRAALVAVAQLAAIPAQRTAAEPAALSVPGTDLADALLELPAPLRDWRDYVPGAKTAEASGAPPDDAPLPALVRFWRDQRHLWPSPVARSRLLEAVEQDHDLLDELVNVMPEDPASVERIKTIYDQEIAAGAGASWSSSVRRWLTLHGMWFRDELEADARSVRYDLKQGQFESEEALRALAVLDPAGAAGVLEQLARSAEPRLRVLALAVSYDSFLRQGDERSAVRARKELQKIARSRKAAPRARSTAIDALLGNDWPGRDQFFFALLEDSTLIALTDGESTERPLADFVARNPDRYIPRLAELARSPDPAVQANIVACLAQFHAPPRPDALRPILPFLLDPDHWPGADRTRRSVCVRYGHEKYWSSMVIDGRRDVLNSLAMMDAPEAAPALIDELRSGRHVSAAAAGLARNRNPRAIPPLREALVREDAETVRRAILDALVANDGLDPEWAAGAVERVAALGDEGLELLYGGKPNPVDVSTGLWLGDFDHVPDAVAEAVFTRASEIEAARPEVARRLREIASRWKCGAVDLHLLAALSDGSLTAPQVRNLLDRKGRPLLPSNRLDGLRQGSGLSAGIAAALSDSEDARTLLAGSAEDPDAVRALLAGARLRRRALPLEDVAPLLAGADKQVAVAAMRYLEAWDTREARELVRKAYPDEYLVFGSRMSWDPGHFSYRQLDAIERRLMAQMTGPDAPDAIYALATGGYWSSGKEISIGVRGENAELIVRDDPAHYGKRALERAELDGLRAFLADERVEELPPLDTAINDGIQVEFLALGPTGGYRVFMNNPGRQDGPASVYGRLTRLLTGMAGMRPLERVVAIVERVPGARLLQSDPAAEVSAVWAAGDDVRVLVRNRDGETWRRLVDGRVGERTERPLAVPDVTPCRDSYVVGRSTRWVSVAAGRGTLAGDADGLWLCTPDGTVRRIRPGRYFDPVVSSDGRWAVAARTDTHWADPNGVVVLDLQEELEHPVDVPPADTFDAVAYVAPRARFLVYRQKDQPIFERAPAGPESPEYRLLDPSTRTSEVVTGEFGPFMQRGWRPLQPTGRPDEAWAAVPAGDPGMGDRDSVIGRYDTRRFTFMPVLFCPELRFTGTDMWVDEGRVAYVAYEGLVISLPLPDVAADGRQGGSP